MPALSAAGNVLAGQAIRQAGRDIGSVLAGAVNLLNPEIVIVWGYLADAEHQLFAGMLVVENGLAPSAVDAYLLAHLTSGRA